MYSILKIFIVSLMLTTLAQAEPQLPTRQGLSRLFFSSRMTAQDPKRTMACFTDYITSSTQISGRYSTDYNACIQSSKDSRKVVDKEVSAEHQSILALAQGVCGRLHNCNVMNSSLELFSCHAESGSINTKETYAISANSSDYGTILQERYRAIQSNEEKCCALTERIYVKDTTLNYDNLQACLSGEVQPSSSTTTTTTTTTTSKPTAGPQETENPEDIEKLLSLM